MKEKAKLIVGKDVIAEEHEKYVKPRRAYAKIDAGDPEKDAVGLGLSGGGIRSATFNLGILQAVELYGFLKRVDYLSTVSGGGYIGSALTWFMSFHRSAFPFPTERWYGEQYKAAQKADTIGTLHEHASYLTPSQGLNLWSLIAFILGGTLINLLVIIPLFS
ncbi:hypothetical conserved protein [Candidatus Nitrosoglobus terrae]|uniref:Hypothetical conserved protein n=1 Tax=Candidatus Nitrosoglobus terrae TaxID=1630141 RepID=A0A1Q2SLZ6_9GAMM|nr:patatin-like phospholipase family protein [Candidatus Nitrosoglobus terrae]BAW80141.1 hypothetical conserved protein [Candidatus Nitrosoglobus terrae]